MRKDDAGRGSRSSSAFWSDYLTYLESRRVPANPSVGCRPQVYRLDAGIRMRGLARRIERSCWEWIGRLFCFCGHRHPESLETIANQRFYITSHSSARYRQTPVTWRRTAMLLVYRKVPARSIDALKSTRARVFQ